MSNKVGVSLGLFPYTKDFYHLKEVVCLPLLLHLLGIG